MQASLDMLDEISTPLNNDLLGYVAETAMIGKGAENALQLLSGLVVESLGIVSENVEEPGAENVSMFKSGKGSLSDSTLIRGVAFRRRVPMDGLPNNLQDAKVAVIGGDIKIRSMTRDAQIKISSADQLESFVNAEQARKEDIATRIPSHRRRCHSLRGRSIPRSFTY